MAWAMVPSRLMTFFGNLAHQGTTIVFGAQCPSRHQPYASRARLQVAAETKAGSDRRRTDIVSHNLLLSNSADTVTPQTSCVGFVSRGTLDCRTDANARWRHAQRRLHA